MNPLHLEGCETLGDRSAWATVSACGKYRYALGRAWDDPANPDAVFSIVMLNPSTADHADTDPTIRKCIHFAKQEHCGSLFVRNLFAWRTPYVKELRDVVDPVGPLNLDVLGRGVAWGTRVAAWGQLDRVWLRRRAQRSLGVARMTLMHVLGLTERGYDRSSSYADQRTRQPRHPLFVPNATRLVRWSEASAP